MMRDLHASAAAQKAPDTAPMNLDIQGLSKRFPGRKGESDVVALDQVSLQVRKGEFVALLGPSGCGKSTLLSICAGFRAPSAGTVLQDGRPIQRPDATRTVVFQDYALFGWMTVQQNIEFGLKAKGMGRAQRAEVAGELLARVRLSGFKDNYPHEISGGMKQRAAIARALAPEPEILLMDEPFGALDAQTRVLLQEEVARLTSDGRCTVLFVTHSIEEAAFLADRIVVMSPRPGRIRSEVAVPLARPRVPDMRTDPWFVQAVHRLWETLKPEWKLEVKE
jgi:NitT/TauT family transport system ATP-binding protein